MNSLNFLLNKDKDLSKLKNFFVVPAITLITLLGGCNKDDLNVPLCDKLELKVEKNAASSNDRYYLTVTNRGKAEVLVLLQFSSPTPLPGGGTLQEQLFRIKAGATQKYTLAAGAAGIEVSLGVDKNTSGVVSTEEIGCQTVKIPH